MNSKTLRTPDLTKANLPRKNADWRLIVTFASTFSIEDECPQGIEISGIADVDEASDILTIRAAFYLEWRRWNHRGGEPDRATMQHAWKLLDHLRAVL